MVKDEDGEAVHRRAGAVRRRRRAMRLDHERRCWRRRGSTAWCFATAGSTAPAPTTRRTAASPSRFASAASRSCGGSDGLFSFIHVEDAAGATVAACRARRPGDLQRRRRRARHDRGVAAGVRGRRWARAPLAGAAGWRGSCVRAVRGADGRRAARRVQREGQARARLAAALRQLEDRFLRGAWIGWNHRTTEAQGDGAWLTPYLTSRTTTTPSSRTSTSRRCGSTTTSTIRPTSTRRTPRSTARTGPTRTSTTCCAASTSCPTTSSTAVRNNAGGHSNHSFFWQIMSPDGGGEPDGDLASAIDEAFGSLRRVQGRVQDRRRQPLRLRLGVAGPRRIGARRGLDREPGLADLRAARRRCWASTSGSTPTT